jgi:S1-C subfamily serine protease
MFTQLTLATALAMGAPALKEKEPLGTGPGYLGITFTKDADGLVVTDVKADGPAAKAGVKEGDVLFKIDAADLKDADTSELVKLVGGMRPGTVIAVDLRRGKESLTLKIKLGARPADFAPMPSRIPPPPIDRPSD